MNTLMQKLRAFARDEGGASLAEYAILLLIAAVSTGILVVGLRGAVEANITDATTAVNG
jgi:Flp pilus assembly pilin Flp